MELKTLTFENCTVNAIKTNPNSWTVRYYFRQNKVSAVQTYAGKSFPIDKIAQHVKNLNTAYKACIDLISRF